MQAAEAVTASRAAERAEAATAVAAMAAAEKAAAGMVAAKLHRRKRNTTLPEPTGERRGRWRKQDGGAGSGEGGGGDGGRGDGDGGKAGGMDGNGGQAARHRRQSSQPVKVSWTCGATADGARVVERRAFVASDARERCERAASGTRELQARQTSSSEGMQRPGK